MAIEYDPLFIISENLSLEVTSPAPLTLRQDGLKRITAYKAVAKHAVDQLLRQGKLENIVVIPTSKITQEQALSVGILLLDLGTHLVINLSIDGTDKVNLDLNFVKGREGSLLREKMIKGASNKFVVIVEASWLFWWRSCRFVGSSQQRSSRNCKKTAAAL